MGIECSVGTLRISFGALISGAESLGCRLGPSSGSDLSSDLGHSLGRGQIRNKRGIRFVGWDVILGRNLKHD